MAPIWCSVCGHRSQVLWKHSVTQLQSSDPSALRCCAAVTGSHNAFIAEILGSMVCGASDAQHPMLRSLRSSYFSFSAYFEAREIECIRSLGPHFWVNSLPPSAELQDCAPSRFCRLRNSAAAKSHQLHGLPCSVCPPCPIPSMQSQVVGVGFTGWTSPTPECSQNAPTPRFISTPTQMEFTLQHLTALIPLHSLSQVVGIGSMRGA